MIALTIASNRRLSLQIQNKAIVRCLSLKRHNERKLISQPINILYEVVSDVDNYQQFVPWCKQSAVIIRKDKKHITAELDVGFSLFSEKYSSEIELNEPYSVVAISKETKLFEYLRTEWKFSPSTNNSNYTWVTFQVDFQFKSSLYNEVSNLFLKEVINKMVHAFEDRCMSLSERKLQKTLISHSSCVN